MFHNQIVQDLFKRLKSYCSLEDIVNKEQEYDIYFRKQKKHGEIDLYLIHRNYNIAYAIEVKSTNTDKSYKKAKYQLEKDVNFLFSSYNNLNKIYCFYAYTKKGNDKTRFDYNVKLIKIIKKK